MWQKCLVIVPALVLAGGTTARSQVVGKTLAAVLKGFQEVPAVSTVAAGFFHGTINEDETAIAYQLHYEGLEGAVTQAHIHFGQPLVAGGIAVWLCGNTPPTTPPPGTPSCPDSGVGPEVTGTLTADNIVGPTGQGIAAGEFAELINALRKGNAYANVHTAKFPGGEVRGQIVVR
jgi:hypothetical protein